MDKAKSVSIIVPCYNCQRTINKCVESILNQTYSNIEILLVDDGSTDNTPQICDDYARIDHRVIVLHQKNGGLVNAWKNGVKLATGEFIAFCDSDDYVDSDLAERVIRIAELYHVDLVTYGITTEYMDGSIFFSKNNLANGILDGEALEDLKRRLLFSGKMHSQKIMNSRCSKLIKRSILMEGIDDITDELTNGEDAVMTYMTVLRANSVYNIMDYYPYHYCRNDQSMVGKLDVSWFSKMVLMREELLKISGKYNIEDNYQIDNFFFSYVMMYAKKEISRNVWILQDVIKHLSMVRNSSVIEEVMGNVDIARYSATSKLFAFLFIYKNIKLLCYMTKLAVLLGMGKQ